MVLSAMRRRMARLAELSPYQTEHINRFGHYALNFSPTVAALSLNFRKPPQSATATGAPKALLMPTIAGQRA
jgi:hypothetical protein